MKCLHPQCPMGHGCSSWDEVLSSESVNVRPRDRAVFETFLDGLGPPGAGAPGLDRLPKDPLNRLLKACPCLFTQLDVQVTAPAVVHLCEITLEARIDSTNVEQAFRIQNPRENQTTFSIPPVTSGAGGGNIMEYLCSEVLANHGIPEMSLTSDGWPDWHSPSHILLNTGKMQPVRIYGDILIPSAPHNLLISVKSESARERLLSSGNRLESVGFGFFNDASEFWNVNRMNSYKRWGFVAIYMPKQTHNEIYNKLKNDRTRDVAININGNALYRPLEEFGRDMKQVAGRVSRDL